MQTTQPHSKTLRRGPAPVSHTIGIECTDQDILEAIAQIAATQSTCFVMIAKLAVTLGLTVDDRDWLIGTLKVLDTENSIHLSCVEHPQHLALYQASWYVRNASGVPCHEVAVNLTTQSTRRIAPLLRRQAPAQPVIKPATDTRSHQPTAQKCRISELVHSAAATLFGKGSRPQTQVRVLPDSSASTQEAA